MTDWGKIAIAVRCGFGADPLFLQRLITMLYGGIRKDDVMLEIARECPHAMAAEYLAKLFLRQNADTILFIDDDMIFKADDLELLRSDERAFDFDILSAMYCSRCPPHAPLVVKRIGTELACQTPVPQDSIEVVDAVGLGFAMIRRHVFETISQSWFCGAGKFQGEDFSFCERVEKHGFKMAVDTRVNIGHRFKVECKWNFEEGGVEFTSRQTVRTNTQ